MIETQVGWMGVDDHQWLGRWIFAELLDGKNTGAMLCSAAAGRLLDDDEQRLFDAVTVCTALADPRIWPLKLTRIAASYGGALHGAAAALLGFDNPAIGPWTVGGGVELLRRIGEAAGESPDDARLWSAIERELEGRRLKGYGVALREVDERAAALRRWVASSPRASLPFWRLFERVEALLIARIGLHANIGGLMAALFADMNLEPARCQWLAVIATCPPVFATALEGAAQRADELVALRPDQVRYVGPARRPSPRSLL